VGTVVVTSPTSVTVSLTVVGIVNQTAAHLHVGGAGGLNLFFLWALIFSHVTPFFSTFLLVL
jgi:hypothetical protein